MSLTQIKVGGFGGQGVVMSGTIIGKASAIFDNKFATMTRSYGPEARGGACGAQIVISDTPVTYPYVIKPDVLVTLSQEACSQYLPDLAENGTLLYESDLVTPGPLPPSGNAYGITCTRLAEELGSRVVLNIVMLGFLAKMCNAISKEALEEAIRITVPSKTIDINLNAFKHGYNFEPIQAAASVSA